MDCKQCIHSIKATDNLYKEFKCMYYRDCVFNNQRNWSSIKNENNL